MTNLSQLTPDKANLNTGTEAGADLLDKSLDEVDSGPRVAQMTNGP